jgi:PIN domain nuclease of toxin-antitoxin system
MRILFDTHAFLWWFDAPERLSEDARHACLDPNNELLLSVVTLWEIQVKRQIGKLTLTRPLREIVEEQERTNGTHLIAVRPEHVYALDALPLLHRDPFDRLLIAQANAEGAALLSMDSSFSGYPVTLLW